jgi:arylsulfatase A-like enzyme
MYSMKIIRNMVMFALLGGFISCKEKSSLDVNKKTPPNVLFIAIDDLNDWTGFLGGRDGVYTPNLDALAARGMAFTNAHCSAPACGPSRASLMTGIRPSTSGIYDNSAEWRKSPVLAHAKTIPEYFREAGYIVKGGGKIFHALSWIRDRYGIDQNDPTIWDAYFPSKERSLPESVWPKSAVKDSTGYVSWQPLAGNGTAKRPSGFFDYGALGNNEEMADYKVVDWAVDELNKEHKKPLFLAVGIFRPHIPWFVPKEYFDRYPIENITLPKIEENDLDDVSSIAIKHLRRDWQKWMLTNNEWKKAIQAYQASVTFSDAMVGRLIEGLEKSGKLDETIIVLWSDHGMHIGEKEQWEKFTLWEESTRVPLIVVAPGTTKASTKTGEAVSLLDVYPTLVELSGGMIFEQLEGQSLKPLLENPLLTREKPAVTTWHYNNHAIRTKNWRYISYSNGDEELYNHKSDPDEFYNLANKPENRVLMDSLQQWMPKTNFHEID